MAARLEGCTQLDVHVLRSSLLNMYTIYYFRVFDSVSYRAPPLLPPYAHGRSLQQIAPSILNPVFFPLTFPSPFCS